MSINFEEFELIPPNLKKQKAMVISILQNGSINFNTKLLGIFPDFELEMRIHSDARTLLIRDFGDIMIKLNKNGSIRNDYLFNVIEKNKIKLPAYYLIERNEIEKIWVGKLYYDNPNLRKMVKDKRQK